jgi:hypothetical protein
MTDPERTEAFDLPRRAVDYQRMLMDEFQKAYDRRFDRTISRSNEENSYLSLLKVSAFSETYLLGVLRSIDPAVADKAAAALADQLDAGDALGEWVYQWREEIDLGEPMTLLFEREV